MESLYIKFVEWDEESYNEAVKIAKELWYKERKSSNWFKWKILWLYNDGDYGTSWHTEENFLSWRFKLHTDLTIKQQPMITEKKLTAQRDISAWINSNVWKTFKWMVVGWRKQWTLKNNWETATHYQCFWWKPIPKTTKLKYIIIEEEEKIKEEKENILTPFIFEDWKRDREKYEEKKIKWTNKDWEQTGIIIWEEIFNSYKWRAPTETIEKRYWFEYWWNCSGIGAYKEVVGNNKVYLIEEKIKEEAVVPEKWYIKYDKEHPLSLIFSKWIDKKAWNQCWPWEYIYMWKDLWSSCNWYLWCIKEAYQPWTLITIEEWRNKIYDEPKSEWINTFFKLKKEIQEKWLYNTKTSGKNIPEFFRYYINSNSIISPWFTWSATPEWNEYWSEIDSHPERFFEEEEEVIKEKQYISYKEWAKTPSKYEWVRFRFNWQWREEECMYFDDTWWQNVKTGGRWAKDKYTCWRKIARTSDWTGLFWEGSLIEIIDEEAEAKAILSSPKEETIENLKERINKSVEIYKRNQKEIAELKEKIKKQEENSKKEKESEYERWKVDAISEYKKELLTKSTGIVKKKNKKVLTDAWSGVIIEETEKRKMQHAWDKKLPCLLKWQAWTWKSTMIKALVKENWWELVQFNFNWDTNVERLLWCYILVQWWGESVMKWQDWPLTDAVRNGKVFLGEELNSCPSEVSFILNGLLENRKWELGLLSVQGNWNEQIKAHPNFRFFGTYNPGYLWTKTFSQSLMSRFIWLEIAPLKEEEETKLLTQFFPECVEHIEPLVKLENALRANKDFSYDVSTRDLVLALNYIEWGFSIAEALDVSIKNSLQMKLDEQILTDTIKSLFR